MIKFVVKQKAQSRRDLSTPHSVKNLKERLILSGALDLKNNIVEEVLGDGYVSLKPIDKSKKFK